MIPRVIPEHTFNHMPDVSHATARGNGQKHGVPHQVDTREQDPSSLSKFNEPEARKLLNDRILSALSQHIDPTGTFKFDDVQKIDFSPEAVAKRILGFVENALAQTEGNEQANGRLLDAREGIKKGFGEAKDILTNLNAYQGEVEKNAEKTYDLLQLGLDNLQKAIDEGSLQQQSLFSVPNAIQKDYLQEASFSRSESFELKVKTRDGDDVTIKISKNQSAEDKSYLAENGHSRLEYRSENTSASSSFSYEVEGELDDEELKAIDSLLGNVKSLSDDFFGSDVQGAFEHALSIGYDTREIAAFSLELHQNEERRVTTAYREIAQYDSQARNSSEGLSKLLQPINYFMGGLKNSLDEAEQSQLFDSPKEAVSKLFADVSRLPGDFQELIERLEERANQSLEGITEQMISQIKPFTE